MFFAAKDERIENRCKIYSVRVRGFYTRAEKAGKMYIIVGLGNPGKQYENTRHNIGFDVVDELAGQEGTSLLEKKHRAVIGKGSVEGQKCILVKPQTFMNLSGESVRMLTDYYKIDETKELIVISDDVSLDIGQIRIRKKGSAGGHNGLKNIIANLGHEDFMRIKVGVGHKPQDHDLVDHVLGHFTKGERAVVDQAVDMAVEAIRVIIARGVDAAMNDFNGRIVPADGIE